jgi:cytidyltransferase-like protein
MNELSQYLVNQILLEETELHNFVVVYSGRFQPFHKGHYATYQNLCKKFGKDRVFIGTSNKTDNKQSPFNFTTGHVEYTPIGYQQRQRIRVIGFK